MICCILFLFAIDVVDPMYFVLFVVDAVVDEVIISFCYACKIKRIMCDSLFGNQVFDWT